MPISLTRRAFFLVTVPAIAFAASVCGAAAPCKPGCEFCLPVEVSTLRFVVENWTTQDLKMEFLPSTSMTKTTQTLGPCRVQWYQFNKSNGDYYILIHSPHATYVYKLSDNADFPYVADSTGFGNVDNNVQFLPSRLQVYRNVADGLGANPALAAEANAVTKAADAVPLDPCAIRPAVCALLAKTYQDAPKDKLRAWNAWDQVPRPVVERNIEERLKRIQELAQKIAGQAWPAPVQKAAQDLAIAADKLLYQCPRPTDVQFSALVNVYQPLPAAIRAAKLDQPVGPANRPLLEDVNLICELIKNFSASRVREEYLRVMGANHHLVGVLNGTENLAAAPPCPNCAK